MAKEYLFILQLEKNNNDKPMKHYRILYLATCMVALLLGACRESQPAHIQLVCTSDVHGNLMPHNFLTGEPAQGSLARVSSYLKEQRERGVQVLYIDNGDMLQGTPATYCYNTYAIGATHVAAEALNLLGCEAVVLGNNDIETGGPTYQRYDGGLEGMVLGGNIMYRGSDRPFFAPYTIIERSGLKIAILGLTTPAIPHWVPQCQWPELEFIGMERAAQRWMQHLRENADPDIVVGLFHSGYEGGITTEHYVENATRAVAERVPGFDAIFYGHDHRMRTTEVINVEGDTVLLLNPGKDAHNVATLDIVRNKEGGVSLHAALADMDAYEPDPEYMEAMAPHATYITEYVERTIGTSTQAAYTRDALFGPSAYTDLIHQMQLNASGAKISFAAPLVYDGVLPEGDIQVRDIYRLFPYENTLYMLWLTGHEIKRYLEYSYALWSAQMGSPNSSLLLFDATGKDLQHPYYHFDSAAGIRYDVDVTKPAGQKVTIHGMADGKPFSMDERYLVAMNSYRAHGGGGLLTHGAGLTHEEMLKRIEYTTSADLRFYMLNYIEMRKNIAPKPLGHWRFVPERWAVAAAKRDRTRLFGE